MKFEGILMLKRTLLFLLVIAVCLPALAKPKKKTYGNGADLFTAALRTARERHVVTYVDEKMLMFTFQTGHSFFTKGFIANASIEPQGDTRATLIINVQTKDGEAAWGAGDRMADKFFDQVQEELAGEVKQKSAIKAEQANIPVAPPKAIPPEPSLTTTATVESGKGTVLLRDARQCRGQRGWKLRRECAAEPQAGAGKTQDRGQRQRVPGIYARDHGDAGFRSAAYGKPGDGYKNPLKPDVSGLSRPPPVDVNERDGHHDEMQAPEAPFHRDGQGWIPPNIQPSAFPVRIVRADH